MKPLPLLAAAALAVLGTGAVAAPRPVPPRPVVVELFTSQACSSCPPADALLRRLAARDKDILALDLHVTYWNGPAYRDPFALAAATARQNWYARLRRTDTVYTPEAVIDGGTSLVGSREAAMDAAIAAARARANARPAVPIRIAARGGSLSIALGAGPVEGGSAAVLLFGYDRSRTTHAGGGENAGATLSDIDVVRSVTRLGTWQGQPRGFTLPRPAGQRVAVLVQAADGTILGAARR